jgi:uncharacterized surface anchored protein
MGKTSIARIAVTAGLSFAAMTSMMPVVPAMAAVSYGTGSIVINKVDGNGDVTYDGYQIFKANVTDDTSEDNATGKTETNVAWANDDVKTAVEKLIKSKDANYAGKTAEDAATYISGKITKTDNTTRVDAASFANELAKAVDGKTSTTSVTPGTVATLDEGYWLFVTNTATDSKTDTVGTAPIFTVVGGATQVTVIEKTTVPTVSKQVKNDATGAGFTSVADAEAGQSVAYELTGTVADNVATYDTYKYAFSDVLSTGLVANEDSVKVSIGGKEIATDSYTKHYDTGKNTLSVSFDDLKAAKYTDGSTVDLTGSSKVVVDYTASLDPSKAIVLGGEGNVNTVTLTYSNNPHSDGTGTTTPKTAKLFAYKLQLHKIDRTTETNLQGAKFTIQATGDDDGSSTKYVQSNGTLGDTAYEFETDKDGNINVTGLDAGTYTVTETVAPAGYDKVDSFTFQIKPTYDDAHQTLTKLENVLTATDSVIAGDTDGVTTDNVLTASGKNAADTATGTVKITVGDVKRVTMPLTGMDGVTFTWIAGGTVLAIGLANIIRTKRHADGSAE